MATKLIRHGTEAGYRAEIDTGNICERCRHAHREYNRQFTKAGKAKGIKIARDQVVTLGGPVGSAPGGGRVPPVSRQSPPASVPAGGAESHVDGSGTSGEATAPGPSLADRMGTLLGRMVNETPNSEYVGESDIPEYLQGDPVDPDPEPSSESGEWSKVTDEEFVINAAGIAKIEENLGTYISVLGITMEMVDPYCGAILANNIPKMVEKWAKVIAHYPKAANLFLDSGAGIVMQWIGAIQASWPFLYAIYEHHLARTVRVHDGVIERKIPQSSAFRGFDATTPPTPDNFAYTVN